MKSDGTDLKRITNNTLEDLEPSLSSDGKKVAFISNKQMYVSDIGSNTQKKLLESSDTKSPIWSPDGSKIAFVSGKNINIVNSDGTEQKNITNNSNINANPIWSPDGSKIAFVSQRNSKWNIYIIDSDGKNEIKLTDSLEDKSPSWSPDSKKIAFVSTLDEGGSEINIINLDGTQKTKLSLGSYTNLISWSKDASSIFYSSEIGQNDEIMTVKINGKDETNLTKNKANDSYPKN